MLAHDVWIKKSDFGEGRFGFVYKSEKSARVKCFNQWLDWAFFCLGRSFLFDFCSKKQTGHF